MREIWKLLQSRDFQIQGCSASEKQEKQKYLVKKDAKK
jgi:hypothetical protein